MPVGTQPSRTQALKEKDENLPVTNPAVDPRKIRRVIAEDPDWNLETVLPLTDLCVKHLISNFAANPVLDELIPAFRKKVLDGLPTTIPIHVTGPLIEEEGYWERCCRDRWSLCVVDYYNGSWKRMFFERHIEEMIETFVPLKSDEKKLIENLKLASDYVKRLKLSQLMPTPSDALVDEDEMESDQIQMEEVSRDHIDLSAYLKLLQNLQELEVTFGINKCGMNFEWNLFEFTKNDCLSLAKFVKGCGRLRVLRVRQSKMTDERARLLLVHLLDHPTLEILDLSHNKLGDASGRALGKLLNGHSVLKSLLVADNVIGPIGGTSIGKAIQNSVLERLDIRLNRLGDEGVQPLLKSLMRNTTLIHLNIGSNDFTESSAMGLSEMLAANETLKTIDITCNKLGENGGKLLQEGVEENSTVTMLDLRLTEISAENEYTINQKIKNNSDKDDDLHKH